MSTNLYVINDKLTISGPNPRQDKFACRNCHQSGHTAKECPEPRSAEGVECKKCGESKKLEVSRWLQLLTEFQLVTLPRIALPLVVEALALAVTAMRRITLPRSAQSPRTVSVISIA